MARSPNISFQRTAIRRLAAAELGPFGGVAMLILSIALAAGPASALSSSGNGAEKWFDPSKVTLTTDSPPEKDLSVVSMIVAKNGDIQLQVSGRESARAYSGSLLIVSGNRLLVRGLPISPGAAIDVVDGPALQIRLLMELLARACPEGPASVGEPRDVSRTDAGDSIAVNTPSAEGEFPAPWSVKGRVAPEGDRRRFDLIFTFQGANRPMHLSGTWEGEVHAPELPDSTLVQGWRVFVLGPYSREDGGSTIFDYGAQEIHETFSTLGEVRRAAKAKE